MPLRAARFDTRGVSGRPERCHLHAALGETEACPEGACPFWLDDRRGGSCLIEELDVDARRPDIARVLLDVRRGLEEARDDEERAEARKAMAAFVPPELSGR